MPRVSLVCLSMTLGTLPPIGGACSGGSDGPDPPALGGDVTLTQVPCSEDADCAALAGTDGCHAVSCETVRGLCTLTDLPLDCGQRVCGDVACGSCGKCGDGEACTDDGRCVVDACGDLTFEGCCTGEGAVRWCNTGTFTVAEQACGGAGCGWTQYPTGDELYDCAGLEIPSPDASLPWLCPGETCETDCELDGKECGWACGERCGDCEAGATCTASGFCLVGEAIGLEGCCDGSGLYYFFEGEVVGVQCGGEGQLCGWNANSSYYQCGYTGDDPTGVYLRDCAEALQAWQDAQAAD